jgi:hypothetical protein
MSTPDKLPYRVVDRDNYGWYQAGNGDGGSHWTTGLINGLDTDFGTYPELVAERGPVRPVELITDADRDALHALFRQAGRKTITSLAAALEQVFHQLREQHCGGRWDLDSHGGYEYAKRTMMAGRAGSWEADLLISVTMFGNALNLAKPTRALWDVDKRRAAGPVKRVDKAARDGMVAIIWRWVTSPERYTELAETLAYVVSAYCDDAVGPAPRASRGGAVDPDLSIAERNQEIKRSDDLAAGAGWRPVADQWLMPGGLAQEDFSMCYRLFYSLSAYMNPSLT